MRNIVFNRKTISLFISTLIFTISCAAHPVVTKSSGSDEETLNVKKGQNFSIKLDSQMSTGFSWKAVEISSIVKLKDEKVKTEESGKTGGLDIQEFIFTPLKQGNGVLLFQYGEHWKKDPKFINTFKVNVNIQ